MVLGREGTLAGTGGWLVTLHLCGSGRRKQEGWPGSKMSGPSPSYASPPSSLNLLKGLESFQTATLAGDKLFKYLILWGVFPLPIATREL